MRLSAAIQTVMRSKIQRFGWRDRCDVTSAHLLSDNIARVVQWGFVMITAHERGQAVVRPPFVAKFR